MPPASVSLVKELLLFFSEWNLVIKISRVRLLSIECLLAGGCRPAALRCSCVFASLVFIFGASRQGGVCIPSPQDQNGDRPRPPSLRSSESLNAQDRLHHRLLRGVCGVPKPESRDVVFPYPKSHSLGGTRGISRRALVLAFGNGHHRKNVMPLPDLAYHSFKLEFTGVPSFSL